MKKPPGMITDWGLLPINDPAGLENLTVNLGSVKNSFVQQGTFLNKNFDYPIPLPNKAGKHRFKIVTAGRVNDRDARWEFTRFQACIRLDMDWKRRDEILRGASISEMIDLFATEIILTTEFFDYNETGDSSELTARLERGEMVDISRGVILDGRSSQKTG